MSARGVGTVTQPEGAVAGQQLSTVHTWGKKTFSYRKNSNDSHRILYLYSVFMMFSDFLTAFLPQCLGKLRQLRYLDLAKNRIESLDSDVSGCEALEDLLMSSNMLQHLPDSIGTQTYTTETHRHIVKLSCCTLTVTSTSAKPGQFFKLI